MPRWPNAMISASFFLFESKQDAENGAPSGGCGFFIGIDWESRRGRAHVYAVTCKHVIASKKPHCLRATKINATEPSFIPAETGRWTISSTDDLAVMRIDDGERFDREDFSHLNMTDQIISDYSIGIGDEVVSVGRFVDLHGHRTNRPMIRSGIIASMPELPVVCRNRQAQDSYIVEMRSRSGFSGSPVFVYLPPPQLRFETSDKQIFTSALDKPLIKMFQFYGPWLLGVHWGEITVNGPDAPMWPSRNDIDRDKQLVELGSGMIGVVPCNRLEALLMKDERVLRERRAAEDSEPQPMAVEQSSPPASDENPTHREDFTRLVGAAARKREPED